MKENSIEETIKQLELILKVRKEQKEIIECAGGSCINCNPDIKALSESIDILSDYKRVLKENEKIRNGRNRLFEYATAQQTTPEMLNKILREDYISIQKVKDKQKEKEWALESYDCDEADYKQSQAIGAWQVLQELIEDNRKNEKRYNE